MNYTFDNERPIYLQIVDIITNEIISGALKPGEKINSVREYALIMKANPNTIVKALAVLEDKKLITTERTNGKFVTSDLSIIKKYKENVILEKVNVFLKEINQMGYTKEEVIKILKEEK